MMILAATSSLNVFYAFSLVRKCKMHCYFTQFSEFNIYSRHFTLVITSIISTIYAIASVRLATMTCFQPLLGLYDGFLFGCSNSAPQYALLMILNSSSRHQASI